MTARAVVGEVGAGVTITPNGTHALVHLLGSETLGRVARTPASGAIKHYRAATGAGLAASKAAVETRRWKRSG